mmetsp:Transcript_143406/g.445816  ORF Transcript_143406/g.445816 Transcript_143406/m.445816 type:complete len:105 (-) Transcript_143406:93-407(-)
MDEAEYKARVKKEPDYMMKMWMDCWTWVYDMMDKQSPGKNVKGLKGKVVLLWPCQRAGRPDPKLASQQLGKGVAEALKTKLLDTHAFTPAQRAAEVLKVLRKDP